MADIQPNTRDVFFSQKNEAMLERLLNTDFQRRLGGELNDKQEVRLRKTVEHYMKEIYSAEANAGMSIQYLNKEVLQSVVPDYLSYLKRQSRPEEPEEMDRIRSDVSNRFEKMQTERHSGRGAPPNPPNFQLSLEDDNSVPSVSRFEELKRQRELEAKRMEESTSALMNKPMPEDMARRIQSDDLFRLGSRDAQQADMALLAVRDTSRQAILEQNRNQILDVPPDPRALLFGDGPRMLGIPNANPTYSLPDSIRTRPVLPQDIIKPQEDIVTYKENEYNLFIYSADRDWVNNTADNRYSFSVNFDPANNRSGFNMSPSTQIKFKNISRIELVKVIMATEACETLSLKSSTTAYDLTKYVNVFSYPYLQVRVDELNTNGFGTNDGLNNSFGVISYDAYWASDSALNNRGFARLIPKFLKCQKVFYPTPLATLNKMTIQIQKPDGTQFCDSADALDVSGAVTSDIITGAQTWMSSLTGVVTGTNYRDTSGEYIWIQTRSWFSRFSVTQGDRVVMKNIAYPSLTSQASVDFINYLTRAAGHTVVDTAQVYKSSTNLNFVTGSNKLGYCNYIIIRNNFSDPTTGAQSLVNWGGTSATNTAFITAITSTPGFSTTKIGRLLNTSHQIQLIFRVITRDMDSAGRIRPDNL